jgi:predicted metal-dependent HD superfamily phosphohydrolase
VDAFKNTNDINLWERMTDALVSLVGPAASRGTRYEVEQFVDNVLRSYSAEGSRRYHTEQHLKEMVALADAIKIDPEYRARVMVAILYHDVTYKPGASGNEDASEERFLIEASEMDLRGAADVALMIRASKHEGFVVTWLSELFQDLDLAILAAPADRYREYSQQIREEFNKASDDEFYPARVRFLREMLARAEKSKLYLTPQLNTALNDQAIKNLRTEIYESEGKNSLRQNHHLPHQGRRHRCDRPNSKTRSHHVHGTCDQGR